ncbi:MAG: PD-(D/E)XK nuclease family protein [Christensenellales bacterium]|jgi:ATP-dependent helicase/nuclease subunit B
MKIYLSNTFYDAYEGIVAELKKRRAEGGNHLIIVPDEFTMNVEKGILTSLKTECALDIEVAGFRRLAMKYQNRAQSRCLSPEGAVMLMAKVLSDNAGKLVYFKSGLRSPAFAKEILTAVSALRNSGFSAVDILEAAKAAEKSASKKLKDLAIIYDAYVSALEDGFSDAGSRLIGLAKAIEEMTDFPANVYVCDFFEFSSPEYEVIAKLATKARSLSVALVVNFYGSNKRLYPNRTYEKLKYIMETAGIKTEVAERFARLKAVPFQIAHNLYSFGDVKPVETDSIKLLRFSDIERETAYIAAAIRRGVVEEGRRYKDFVVVAGDLEEYSAIFKRVFKRFGIPFFIDKKEKLAWQAGIRLLLSAHKAVETDLERSAVLEFVKNPLLGVDSDSLENYVLKYNVDRSRFSAPFTAGGEEAESAEAARALMSDALSGFISVKNRVIAGHEFVRLSKEFLEKLGYEKKLADYIEQVRVDSRFYAECLEQVDGKLKLLFSEIEAVFGERREKFKLFCDMFASAVSALEVALIPMYADCVFIGEMGESRYADVNTMFVVGAHEGKIPREVKGASVITDAEEAAFLNTGRPLFSTRLTSAKDEIFFLIQLLAKPKEKIYVTASDLGQNGEFRRPSTLFNEFENLFIHADGSPLTQELINAPKASASPSEREIADFAHFFATPENAYHEIMTAASERLPKHLAAPYEAVYPLLSMERKKALAAMPAAAKKIGALPPLGGALSAARMETYFTCPYKHFLTYYLGLKKRDESKLDALMMGNIIHAFLQSAFGAAMKMKNGFILSESELKDLANKIFDSLIKNKYPHFLNSAAERATMKRLGEECAEIFIELSGYLKRSKFMPKYLEVKIGGDEIPPAVVDTAFGKLKLIGRIDRVDVYGDKMLIFDYKSSQKASEFSLSQAYLGLKIQIYIYAAAVINATGLRPAGLFYIPVESKFSSDDGKLRRYTGRVAGPEGASDIDSVYPDFSKTLLPVKKADGFIGEKELLGEIKYVEELIAGAAEEIAAGSIAPSPIGDCCKHCDYLGLCVEELRRPRSKAVFKVKSFAWANEDGAAAFSGLGVKIREDFEAVEDSAAEAACSIYYPEKSEKTAGALGESDTFLVFEGEEARPDFDGENKCGGKGDGA